MLKIFIYECLRFKCRGNDTIMAIPHISVDTKVASNSINSCCVLTNENLALHAYIILLRVLVGRAEGVCIGSECVDASSRTR